MRWKLAVLTLSLGLGASFGAPSPSWAQSSTQASSINKIGGLDVTEKDAGTYVRIEGSSVPTFSVYKLDSPPRLLIDVSNSQLAGDPSTEKVNNGVISQVALLEFSDSVQSITRVIVGFDQAAHYDVRTEGNDVVVFVDGEQRTKRSNTNVAAVQEELRKSQSRLDQTRARLDELEANYKRRLAKSQTRVSQAEGDVEDARDRLSGAEAELARLRRQLKSAQGNERDKIESEVAAQRQSIASLKSDLSSQQKAVASLRRTNEKLKSERDAERERVSELVQKMEAALARAEKTQGERDRALELARRKEAEEKAAREQARTLETKLQSTQTELARAERIASASKDAVAQRTRDLDNARQRQSQLEDQIKKLRRAASQGADNSEALAGLEKERDTLSASLQTREKELDRARGEARQAQGRLAELKGTLRTKDAEIARLRDQIEKAQQLASRAEDDRLAALSDAVSSEKKRVAALEDARRAEERQVAALKDAQALEREKLEELQETRRDREAELRAQEQRLAKLQADLEDARNARPAARAVPVADNAVRGIHLETREGHSRIVVDLDRPGAFETLAGSDGRAVMVLNGVDLPSDLEKTLASTDGGAVRYVSTFREDDGRVRVEAELDGSATEVVRQDGNRLVWEFAPRMNTEVAAHQSQTQTRPTRGKSYTSAPPGYPRVVTDPTRVSSVPGMTRKRLTIDLREADIQNVLRLLAKEGGVNIVSGEGVDGTVTLRLRSVPLDEVFLTVLQSRALGFEKRGNVIRVAPQDTLRAEQQARAEERRRNAVQQPLEVFLLPVNYAEAGELENQVSPLLSPRGSVTVDERTNTLIIKDISDNLAAVRALVGNLDTEVPQVLIEARIVETNDTFQQQFGIQWGGDLTFSQVNGNPTGLLFPHVLGIAGGATDGQTPTAGTSSNPNFGVNLPAPAGTGTGGALGLTLGSVGGALNINLRLSALEQAGHAKIISAPKILTLDNRAATISQGTSIPISVVSAAGVQTVFVDATLELTVQPHVTPDGNIQLQISASKNEPDFQNTGARGDPTIIRKQAETELLIRDGDTTVIGGIYTRNAGSAVSAVPFLHKIPILGYFFRTTTESDRRTELLIFITPKIVNRAKALGAVSGGTVSGGVPGE